MMIADQVTPGYFSPKCQTPFYITVVFKSTTPFVLNALFLYYLGYAENLSHQKAMENVNTVIGHRF